MQKTKRRVSFYEEHLQKGSVLEPDKDQVADNGDDVADKTADTAQNQIACAHKQALDRLGNENMPVAF